MAELDTLNSQNRELSSNLWQERLLNLADQIVEHKQYLSSLTLDKRRLALIYQDLESRMDVEWGGGGLIPTDEQKRLDRLRSALNIVRDAMNKDPRFLPSDWSYSEIQRIRQEMSHYEPTLERLAKEARVRTQSKAAVEKAAKIK